MTTDAPIPLNIIGQLMWGHAATSVLVTSVELDVYTAIHAGLHTTEGIARQTQSSVRGMTGLLDALVGFGLLKKEKELYQLTPEAETFLVKSSPYYFGPMIEITKGLAEAFTQLTQAVRTGKPINTVDQEAQGVEFFSKLVAGLFPMNYPIGRFLADKKLLGPVKDVLDVAVGSGAWSIPLAESDRDVRVVGLDFKDVLHVTREFFNKRGVGEQFLEMPGNLRDTDLGEDRYDLVILGHILHSEGAASSRKLLNKAFRALKSGGRVLIAEFIPNNDRTGPPPPLIFTLNMILNTTEGTTFTLAELTAMLTEAGFKSVHTLEAPGPSPLVLAEK